MPFIHFCPKLKPLKHKDNVSLSSRPDVRLQFGGSVDRRQQPSPEQGLQLAGRGGLWLHQLGAWYVP